MESIKYSDLVIDDGAIQKLISELGNLRQTYERDVQAIVSACQTLKGAIKGSDTGTLTKQAAEVDKLKAQYDALAERYVTGNREAEKYKAQIAELRNIMRAEAKAQLETTAATRQAAESYNQLAALYTKLKVELNKYSAEEIANNDVLRQKQAQALKTMEQMKALQAATGRHTLDVGNYSKALNGLNLATQQIVREAPSLAVSINQFFLAISNNIPIFVDNFKRVQDEMKSTKTALMQTVKSLFSWQTALIIGLTVLSKYGNEIIKWTANILGLGKSVDVAAESLKAYNETMSKIGGQMASGAAELSTYIYVLENGKKTEAEQAEIVQLVNEKYAKQIEYLGLNITGTGDLIAAKNKLIEVLMREAEARGVLNKITELSGQIAERETSEELRNLREAEQKALKTLQSVRDSQRSSSVYETSGLDLAGAVLSTNRATNALRDYEAETETLREQLQRLRDTALGLDFGTLLGGGSGSGSGGGSGIGAAVNKDLEYVRAAEDAALAATEDNIAKTTQEIRYEYTRRIEDLRAYLAEQRALEENKREITVVGEQAIISQIKSLHLLMDQEIAQAWSDMLYSQVGDLDKALQTEEDMLFASLERIRTAELKQSLEQDKGWMGQDKDAEKALQLKYKEKQSKIRLDTYGDKDAQETQLLGAEIEYKSGLLELWREDATKTTWEIEALANEIELLKKKADEDTGMSWFEKLEKQLEDKLGKRGLSKITKAVQQAANYVLEQFQAIADARVELAEKMVDAAQTELDTTKSTLDQEIEARNNGYANNVALAQQEYLEKQRIYEESLKAQEEATKQQEALNNVQQVLSLVTASANIFSSLSTIPFGVGIPIAIGLIATMFGAFAAAKVSAAKAASQTYGEGGTELLSGGSHQSGNDIPLGTMPDGRERRAEGGEYLAIINKRNSRKYGSLIPSIVDALNAGVFEQKFGDAFRGGAGVVVNVDGSADAIERFHSDMKRALNGRTETRLADGTRIITCGHTRRIIRS